MRKRLLFALLCFAIIFGFTIPISPMAHASPGTIYVPDNYPSIQAAVNAASPGDTIIVRAGNYYGNVHLNKQLTLVGENLPVIDANGSGSPMTLEADGCAVDGFKVRNSGGGFVAQESAGIKVISNNNRLTNNIALNNWYGIYLYYSNGNALDRNNTSNNSLEGIRLVASNNNNLANNTSNSNIYLSNPNTEGAGILLLGSNYNTLDSNVANSNHWFGIQLRKWALTTTCDHNQLVHNTANHWGRMSIVEELTSWIPVTTMSHTTISPLMAFLELN